jgi:outer membrane protein assembly factor BamB
MTYERLGVLTLSAALACAQGVGGASPADWTQFGGPTRDFMVETTGLAASWPASGPRRLWSRALGDGHSSILADGARLFTMYRPLSSRSTPHEEEVVVALDASSGKTLWESRHDGSVKGLDISRGLGPYSTPIVVGDRLFAVTTRRELLAFDKASGKRLWGHDFKTEYGAPLEDSYHGGYSCSPIAYKNTIILMMGGKDQAVAAFDQATGALVWKTGNFGASPSSPTLVTIDGQQQLILLGGDAVMGLDPDTGRTLWSHPHATDFGLGVSIPVWSQSTHLLFLSSAYKAGSRVLELHQQGGKTTVAERWFSRRMRVHFGSIIRLGDYVYASSGDFGPAFLMALDIKTGDVAWQDRAFSKSQLLYADGKFIILDEDGQLGLASMSPQGLTVLAKAPVLQNISWTPPTLVGTTLYARDRRTAVALDLGMK